MSPSLVLALHGEIDFSLGAGEIGHRLAPILRARPGSTIILDLTDVMFADAAFLGALVGTANRLGPGRERTRILVVARAGGIVWRLFAITELDRAFSLFEDCSAALLNVS